jgi:hypothetical protein
MHNYCQQGCRKASTLILIVTVTWGIEICVYYALEGIGPAVDVCVCVCVCVHMYVIWTNLFLACRSSTYDVCMSVYIHMCACMHMYSHADLVGVRSYEQTRLCLYVFTQAMCTHTHTHTQTQTLIPMF